MKRVKVIFTAMILCIAVAMPSNAYAADAEDWASLEGWLSSINGKLGYIYADTTNIYTALSVVKDTVTTISTNVTNIKSSVDDMTDDLAYLPAISSTVTNINTYTSGIYTRLANLSTIKDTVDSHTTLLTTINNNINNVWADVQLIKDTTGYINSAFTTANSHLSNINENIITVGESIDGIATAINTLSSDVSSIKALLTQIRGSSSLNGSTYYYWKTYPFAGSNNSSNYGYRAFTDTIFGMSTKLTNLNTAAGNVKTAVDNVKTSVTDGVSSISQSLNTIHEDLQAISTTLTSVNSILSQVRGSSTLNDNVYYYWKTYPFAGSDNSSNYGYRALTDTIFGMSTKLTNLNTAAGNVKTAVDNVKTSVTDGVSSISQSLNTIHEDLQAISTTLTSVNSILSQVRGSSTLNDNVYYYWKVYPFAGSDNSSNYGYRALTDTVFGIGSKLASLQTTVSNGFSSVGDAIATLHTDLQGIAASLSNVSSTLTQVKGSSTLNDAVYYYWKVYPFAGSNNDSNYAFKAYTDAVFNISSKINSLNNSVPDGLADIWTMCKAIYDKMSIPADSNQIIGDFDTDAFDEEILDLKSVMSQVAPFGAITLVSAEFSILSSVAPVDYPQFVFPFDFGGFDQTLVLDLSWLEQAKGFINFFSMFMLIYCLTIWSIKFIKE